MEPSQTIPLRQARSFSEIINVTFSFLRENFKPLGKAILFIVGPIALLAGVVSGFMDPQSMTDYMTNDPMRFAVLYTATIFLSLITAVALFGVVYAYVVLYSRGERGDVEDIWQALLADFPKLLVVSILGGVAVVIGMFLCFLPGIYLLVAFSISLIVLVVERTGVLEAFSRSMELIRGHWWFTFGLILVIAIIQIPLVLLLYVPQFVVSFMAGFHAAEAAAEQSYFVPYLLTTIVTTVGYYFVQAIPAVAVAFHYFNLVERKEAVGLMERIDDVGAGGETA